MSSKVPVLVEARVRFGLAQDQHAMQLLKARVADLVAAQPSLRDEQLPLNSELLKSLVSVRVSGITDAVNAVNEGAPEEDLNEANDEDEGGSNGNAPSLSFWRVTPNILLYECAEPMHNSDNSGDEPSVPFSSVSRLPAPDLEGLWESLRYSNGVKSRLLAYLSAGAHFRKNGVCPRVICWHGVALLHGPPGTGKTSLCRALAQKLAIRCSAGDPSYLVEVRADAVFSKFFAESARNVGSLFRAVASLAETASHVFVLLDEVESLAGSRTSSDVDGQPADALRAVNALLTALDSVRGVENCTVLATSNLVGNIDPAFLDRVDIHERVPQPGFVARRDIIQECVDELSRAGIVTARKEKEADSAEELIEDLVKEAARAAKGLSGRALRKLPLLAHAAYVRGASKNVPAAGFLRALKDAATTARKNRA